MTQFLTAHTRIAAIVPCYTPSGDSTMIISIDGSTTTVPSRIRTVILRLAKSQAIDLGTLRAKTRATTERKNLEPLPLAPGLVLVPVKVRQPRIPGDTTSGYVNLHTVTAVNANQTKPYQSTIKLSDKTELATLWTTATVNRQLTLARLAASTAPTTQPATFSAFHETYSSYAPELLTLAVKLVDVFNEILSIKQRS